MGDFHTHTQTHTRWWWIEPACTRRRNPAQKHQQQAVEVAPGCTISVRASGWSPQVDRRSWGVYGGRSFRVLHVLHVLHVLSWFRTRSYGSLAAPARAHREHMLSTCEHITTAEVWLGYGQPHPRHTPPHPRLICNNPDRISIVTSSTEGKGLAAPSPAGPQTVARSTGKYGTCSVNGYVINIFEGTSCDPRRFREPPGTSREPPRRRGLRRP